MFDALDIKWSDDELSLATGGGMKGCCCELSYGYIDDGASAELA